MTTPNNSDDNTNTGVGETASTEIAKAATTEITLADKLSRGNSPLFIATYQDRLASVQADLPDKKRINKIIDDLPEEYADKIAGIIRRNMGQRKGIYAAQTRPEMVELRLFHGTGNDPNRPDNMIPGQFYLNSKETVGKQFVGTVIMVYEGRTMWGDKDAGETTRMPICQSMDRNIGSTYGRCEDCPNRPWRDGKTTRCSDDIIAYMLSKDLNDIVLVRFAKTSAKAGQQLIKFIRRTEFNWSKWYVITAEATVNQTDKTQRYFVIQVSPVSSDNEDDVYVPETLQPFCHMMCTVVEATSVLPGIAYTYRQSQHLMGPAEAPSATTAKSGGSVGLMTDSDTPDYGEIANAPDDTTNV
jgi:hypothetical protein